MPRPIHVAMLGAGSFFTNSILKDIVLIPGSLGGELRLIDVDAVRLRLAHELMVKIIEAAGVSDRWTVRSDTERRSLLTGVDYIVNAIEVNGLECVRHDNDIPLRYGVSQCIGDTIGPGGLFKALRTVPVWLEILADCERLCPKAVVLNYTNPMSMMCLAASRGSRMVHVGLCHSVQGTSELLARHAGVPYRDMKWKCAGINHLAWFTELHDANGKDLYPDLMEKARDPESEFALQEPVRSDMMRHFGAFITESSGHLSEYLPYYRKRPDLLTRFTRERYLGEESFYANNWPTWRQSQDASRRRQIAGEDAISLERTWEYGAWIVESIEKNVPIVIHGNVPNRGSIENLPESACVEVACLVDRNGIQPTRFGKLPSAMAAICQSNISMFELGVEAVEQRSIEAAARALMLDPLTAAVCSPGEIHAMTHELLEAEKDYLPGFR